MSVITRTSDCYIALQIVCYQLGRPLVLILFQVTPQSGEGFKGQGISTPPPPPPKYKIVSFTINIVKKIVSHSNEFATFRLLLN